MKGGSRRGTVSPNFFWCVLSYVLSFCYARVFFGKIGCLDKIFLMQTHGMWGVLISVQYFTKWTLFLQENLYVVVQVGALLFIII